MPFKALIIDAGVTKQIPDVETLLTGVGLERATAGALSIGGANSTSLAIGDDNATTGITIGTGTGLTSMSLGSGALVASIGIGTGMGVGDVINLGGGAGGSSGAQVNINANLRVEGTETVIGTSQFNDNATFNGNVTFGDAASDTVTFNGEIVGDVTFREAADHVIQIDDAPTDQAFGNTLTVYPGAGGPGTVNGGTGGELNFPAGPGGAGGTGTAGTGGNVSISGGQGGTPGTGGGAAGGGVAIQGGAGTGNGNGGTVRIDGGQNAGSGVKGDIDIGITHASTVRLGNAADGTIVRLAAGFAEFANGVGAPLSPPGEGRLRYNNTTGTFQVSVSGGGYSDLAVGGAENLAATLAAGPDTGNNNINFTGTGNITVGKDGGNLSVSWPSPATAGNGGSFLATGQTAAATFIGGLSRVIGGTGGAASGASAGGQGGSGRAQGGTGGAANAGQTGAGGLGGSASCIAGNGGAGSDLGLAGAGGSVNLLAGAAGSSGGAGGAAGGNVNIEAGAGTGAGANGTINIGVDALSGSTAALAFGNGTTNPTFTFQGSGLASFAGNVQAPALRFPEQGSGPTAEANTGFVYTKDVTGITELFYREDSGAGGTEIQLTSNGSVIAPALSAVLAQGNITGANDIILTSGQEVQGEAGTGGGSGGVAGIRGGAGDGAGAGGNVDVAGGTGGGTAGDGGTVNVFGGGGGAGGGNGGSVILTPGAGAGGGSDGGISLLGSITLGSSSAHLVTFNANIRTSVRFTNTSARVIDVAPRTTAAIGQRLTIQSGTGGDDVGGGGFAGGQQTNQGGTGGASTGSGAGGAGGGGACQGGIGGAGSGALNGGDGGLGELAGGRGGASGATAGSFGGAGGTARVSGGEGGAASGSGSQGNGGDAIVNGGLGATNGSVILGQSNTLRVRTDQALSLAELGATPSTDSGYGQIYTKSSDSNLYFQTDGGTEYQLTPPATPATETLAQTLTAGRWTGATATTAGNNIVFSGDVTQQDGIRIGGVAGLDFTVAFENPRTGGAGANIEFDAQRGADGTTQGGFFQGRGGSGGNSGGAGNAGTGGEATIEGGKGGDGDGTGTAGAGGSATVRGGDAGAVGTGGANGGAAAVLGGAATGTGGTAGGAAGVFGGNSAGAGGIGGNVELSGGTGASSNGSVNIGVDGVLGTTSAINFGNATTNPGMTITGNGNLSLASRTVDWTVSFAAPAAAGGNAILLTAQTAGVGTNQGGNFEGRAGTGGASSGGVGGAGGNSNLQGGVGGAGTASFAAGAGGEATLLGGTAGAAGGGAGGNGGTAACIGGNGTGTAGNGGLTGCIGGSGVAGGNVELSGGVGSSTNGVVNIGVDGVTGATSAINLGNATTNPNLTYNGNGSLLLANRTADFNVNYTAAAVGAIGRNIEFDAQTGALTFAGGRFQARSGTGGAENGVSAGGAGGELNLEGGTGGAGSATLAAGAGGDVVARAGVAGAANGGAGANGGRVFLTPGVATGAGTNGWVDVANTSAGTSLVKNVTDPVDPQDAATRAWVLNQIGGAADQVVVSGLAFAGSPVAGEVWYVSGDNTLTLADANAAASARFFGVYDGTAGEAVVGGTVTCLFEGPSPTAGSPAYVSVTTAGRLTTTAPTAGGDYVAEVGLVLDNLSATSAVVLIQPKSIIAL